jgi:hypothetical protein
MIIEQQQTIITHYVLNEDEARLVKQALEYANHRQKMHKKCGHISSERLLELLKEFQND